MPDDEENSETNSVEVKPEAEEEKPKFKFTDISVVKNGLKDYNWKIKSNTQFKEFV